jgi:uncharacterized protein YcgI (DUF1989 family)
MIDPEGDQVADVFAFCTDDPSEYHSAEHTRVYVDRLFPVVGEQFVTNRRRGWLPAPTRPGDSTTLRAELDCYLVVSACPQDLVQINAGAPGPIRLEITRS